MKRILLALVLSFLAFSPAHAQLVPFGAANCSIASLSGASQSLLAANPLRRYLLIQDNGTAAVGVNIVGTTAVIGGAATITLQPGTSIEYAGPAMPTSAVTAIGTSSQPITCIEGR